MVAVYAVSVIVGALSLAAWVVVGIVAERPGSVARDPESRFGERGRSIVVAVLGFGLGGMSASYAGWPGGLAFAGALAGAAFLVVSGRLLGVGDGEA